MVEQGEHRLRRARGKAHGPAREHPAQRAVRHAVDILGGIERGTDDRVVERCGQRSEDQASVDRGIVVDAVDHPEELLGAHALGEGEAAHGDADLLAALEGAALVGEVVSALPHPHDGQRRRDSPVGESPRALGGPLGKLRRDGSALEHPAHLISPLTCS